MTRRAGSRGSVPTVTAVKSSDGYNFLPEPEVVVDAEQLAANAKAKRAMEAIKEIEKAVLPPLPDEVVSRGRCRGLPPEWFFGERGRDFYATGRRVCAACPVLDACRDWARSQTPGSLTGLWGGESQGERRQIRADAIRAERERDDPARAMTLAS